MDIGEAVANHVAVCQIVVAGGVFPQQGDAGFACGLVLVLEGGVDNDVGKCHTFALKGAQYQLVRSLEGVGGKGFGAESVLIAHHHQLKIEGTGNERQIAYHPGQKFQFLE